MSKRSTINGFNLKRQSLLRAWMLENGITGRSLAKDLGVTPTCVSHGMRGEQLAGRVHARLLELGAPRDLLGEPRGGTRPCADCPLKKSA